VAQVIELPSRTVGSAVHRLAAAGASVVTAPSRLARPALSVDEWGRDQHLIRALSPFLRARWDVSVGGDQHIPARTGALLVTNTRRMSASAVFVAWSLGEATGRPVRFVGRPDVAPLGAALGRLGALLHDADEVRGALAHGELVVLPARPTSHPRHAGVVDHEIVGAAVVAGVPVLPVASMSSAVSRAARAEVGVPARLRRARRGPLAEVELALVVQHSLQTMLDELGGVHTGVAPIDWLGEG
jgi:hypothetical protein